MIDTWAGTTAAPIRVMGAVTAFGTASAAVQGYETRGTLLLTAGPYQAAAQGRSVTVRVICN